MKETIIAIICAFHIAAPSPLVGNPAGDIKIVDGHLIDISKAPYTVAILLEKRHWCGGSIITKDHVLTAAHCFMNPGSISIRAGSSNWASGGVLVTEGKRTFHPKYDINIYDYDIAIIHLSESLEFSKVIAPVPLAKKSHVVGEKEPLFLTGWGANPNLYPEYLHAVESPKLNFDQCRTTFKFLYINLTERYICTAHERSGHNGCQGDSGGPVIHNGTQVGIMSFGGPCMFYGLPEAHVRVSEFYDWIESVTGGL